MTVYVANILDAVLTLTWVKLQVADEANPLMAALIDSDPRVFFFVKVAAVSVSCVILWVLRKHKLSKWIAMGAAILYIGIITWHIIGSYQAEILVMPTPEELKEALSSMTHFVGDGISQIVDKVKRVF